MVRVENFVPMWDKTYMGRRTDERSLRSIAPGLGVSKSELHRMQQFVEFAKRYKWIQSFTQTPALEIRRALQRIPPDEHGAMMDLLEQCYTRMKAPDVVRAAVAWCDSAESKRRSLYERYGNRKLTIV
jgi:hypothetical protein